MEPINVNLEISSGRYKSLKAGLKWPGIPRLAVVTGLNGSGKTQLLELIALAHGVRVMKEGITSLRDDPIDSADFRANCHVTLDPLLPRGSVLFQRSLWPQQ